MMASQEMEQTSCRVEISGWDAGENFFVEKATLCRCEDSSRKVLLHTALRVGSLVFVRVADEPSAKRSIPVTYEVAMIHGNFLRGAREIRLTQRHPRQAQPRELPDSVLQDTSKN